MIPSHPPPRAGCPRGDPGPLRVLTPSADPHDSEVYDKFNEQWQRLRFRTAAPNASARDTCGFTAAMFVTPARPQRVQLSKSWTRRRISSGRLFTATPLRLRCDF